MKRAFTLAEAHSVIARTSKARTKQSWLGFKLNKTLNHTKCTGSHASPRLGEFALQVQGDAEAGSQHYPLIRHAELVSASYKLRAFTLAEVLITLAIIGVIAAMTIPSVIAKYQELETVSKVKKFYSTMSNALQLAIRDNGTVDEWEYSKEKDPETGYYSSDSFVENLKPYLKLAKDCGGDPKEGCIYDGKYKTLDGADWSANYNTSRYYYKMVLLDGSAMWIRTQVTEHCESSTDGCAIIWYDINGIKEPNMIGKDVFTFTITPNNIYPQGVYIEGVLEFGDPDNEAKCQGWLASQYILQHNNMNYIKECAAK